ncbi:MAG: tetratricopeptide repeat protein, partial [Sandaracinaceae bacterium]|nr:tetratricopeptide repeat protein [Sandaracinaceae bacterium]
ESPRRRARRPEPPVAAPTATDLDRGREAMIAGDLRGAIDHLERYARANPSHAVVQQQLGRAYMRAGDVERGVAAYRRYLRLAPNAPDRAIVERILAPHGG